MYNSRFHIFNSGAGYQTLALPRIIDCRANGEITLADIDCPFGISNNISHSPSFGAGVLTISNPSLNRPSLFIGTATLLSALRAFSLKPVVFIGFPAPMSIGTGRRFITIYSRPPAPKWNKEEKTCAGAGALKGKILKPLP